MHLIKRYSNRKLYDTSTRSYLTIRDLGELVNQGEEVRVVDNDSGKDLTALTLSRVLLEKQRRTGPLLPRSALANLIARSRDSMFDFLRRQMPAWVGSAFVALEDVERNVRSMVEDRQITRAEGRRLMGLLGERIRRNRVELERWVDDRVRTALSRLDIPTASDVERLRRQADALVTRVDALAQTLARDEASGDTPGRRAQTRRRRAPARGGAARASRRAR
ncbi:MAG: phasin family protein [Planctomycetes bacterium]|nr:phasin family protein [Planctomycetota bacterium]